MQTPNNKAGWLTEEIMAAVNKRLPKIEVHEYNAIYGAVYEVLSRQPAALKGKEGGGG